MDTIVTGGGYLRARSGSLSLDLVETSEAQTWPTCSSRAATSSYSGGKAWQKATRHGRIGMKKE